MFSVAEQWPAASVSMRATSELVPYARNARTHGDAQVSQIARSIREFGFAVPVLVDEAGLIIAGHGRVLAAQQLGLVEVPVMTAIGWSDAKKRAYTIADNKLGLNASWDEKLLLAELQSLDASALTGFDAEDVAALSDLAKVEIASEPPASVSENVETMRKLRKKSNQSTADKGDTERYMVIVFVSREAREAAMGRLGLPSDERYVAAASVEIRSRINTGQNSIKASRPARAASKSKAGAHGGT